jgi:hypothetical protein
MADTTQLRNDLAWLAANGHAEFAQACRVRLNWYRDRKQLTPVLLAEATVRVHEHRRAHDRAIVGAQARFVAGRKELFADGGAPAKGKSHRVGDILTVLRAQRWNPTTNRIEVV